MGPYSNLVDQGERIHALLRICPAGNSEVEPRAVRQVQVRLTSVQKADLVAAYESGGGVLDLARVCMASIVTPPPGSSLQPRLRGGKRSRWGDASANFTLSTATACRST